MRISSALVALATITGCAAGPLEVTRVMPPEQASRAQPEMRAVAVNRGNLRAVVPPGAKLEGRKLLLDATYVHRLGPDDVIEKDDQGRIVGVKTNARGAHPREVRFVPGTAVSPEDQPIVRGQLEGNGRVEELLPTDRVVMVGSFAPGDRVPGGGEVVTERSTGLLVGGSIVLALAYLPSAYVGLFSTSVAHPGEDRVLVAPVVGPWIDLATRPSCTPIPGADQIGVDSCLDDKIGRWALVVSGVMQTLGAALVVFGLPAHAALADESRPRAWVAPYAAPGGGGASVVGAF